jgi:hypothetical protein
MAVKLEEDEENVSDILLDSITDRDISAAAHITRLLGSLVECLHDEHDHIYIQFCHPSLRSFLARNPSGDDGPPSAFAFSLESAHRNCAKICMLACDQSCSKLLHGLTSSQAPFTIYAWSFWAFHFKLSEHDLTDSGLLQVFNHMLLMVTGDILQFLLTLSDYVTSRIVLPDIENRLECITSFQRAQQSLISPIQNLCKLRDNLPVAKALQLARDTVSNRWIEYTGSAEFFNRQTGNPKKSAKDPSRRVSQLKRLPIDELFDNEPWLKKEPILIADFIADLARDLRFVAVAFAVSPVYDSIPHDEANQKPAAMVLLSKTSNLFESVASYPYWFGLPDYRNPEDAFLITSKTDEYFGPACFVLHRLDSQETQWLSSETDTKPDWNQIHKKYVRPFHGVPTHRWFAASFWYGLNRRWNTNGFEGLANTFIINPMHNAHMRNSMHFDISGAQYLANPTSALRKYAPRSSEVTATAFIRSLPAIFPVFYAKYIEKLVTAIGGSWMWPWLNFQLGRWQMVQQRVKVISDAWGLLRDPDDSLSYIHCAVGLGLYLIRNRYCPGLGAHLFPEPISDLRMAYDQPVDFISKAIGWTWGACCINVFQTSAFAVLTNTAVKIRSTEDIILAHFANTSLCFFLLTYAERGFCAAANIIALPLAFISSISSDIETLKELLRFTAQYWMRVIISINQTILTLGLFPVLGGWGFLALLIGNYIFILLFINYFEDTAINFLARGIRMILWPLWILSRPLVYMWLPFLKLCGIVIALVGIYFGVASFTAFVNDPLDLKGSVYFLKQATNAARASLNSTHGVSYRLESAPGAGGPARPFTLPRFPKRDEDHAKTE